MLNQDLDNFGLDEQEKSLYWSRMQQNSAFDKIDTINRQSLKDVYNQAMLDLQTIIDRSNPTNAQIVWAIKRLAEIEKQELKYHKSEM